MGEQEMSCKEGCLLLGIGLGAGLLLGSAGSAVPLAQAQPAAPGGAVGRYQISSFAYSTAGVRTSGQESRGAYVIDTVSGDIMVVLQGMPPVLIGSAAKPKTAN
jgi:hypothetical protein